MKLTLAALAFAAVAVTAPAQAVTYFSIPGAVDPGLAPGETMLVNFDAMAVGTVNYPTATTISPGITLKTTLPAGVFNGLSGGIAAPPSGDTTNYFAVGSNGAATFDFTGYFTGKNVRTLSLYVGSLDSYNTLQVLKTDGTVLQTITGTDIANAANANGDQFGANTNRRLYLQFSTSEQVGGLTFLSGQPAFEFDTIAASALVFAAPPTGNGPTPTLPPVVGGSTSLVPEPATWGLMIVGFGLTGFAARRRRVALAA